MTQLLIGIDDTDNNESRGTGFHTRQLAAILHKKKLGQVKSITRHQLFVHPQIPYTSQNSSACMEVFTDNISGITEFIYSHLLKEAVEGCDIGLCIMKYEKIEPTLHIWGKRAKIEVLTQSEAKEIATRGDIYLQGLTGTKDGIIGALAAVALRATGNDGRFIYLHGTELRELSGTYSTEYLLNKTGIDIIKSINNKQLVNKEKILIDGWARPVLQNNEIILFVEQIRNNTNYEWRVARKEYIKSISQ
jgi:hypothetical protein